MPTPHGQRGFTLVEISISVIVAGILVAGALMAQSLVDNARVSATVVQIASYTSAVTQFRKVYVATPGDMTNAGLRLAGCPGVNGAGCNPVGPIDDKIGNTAWAGFWGAPATTVTGGATGAVDVDGERYLFWAHLLLANLIGSVRLDGLNAPIPLQFDVTNPSVPSGGGLVAGYGGTPGVMGPGSIQPGSGVSGLIVVQTLDPKVALQTAPGQLPLIPQRAAQIDRKMDDGLPGSGYVQAYGVSASCFTNAAAQAYNEKITRKDCGLIYRLGN